MSDAVNREHSSAEHALSRLLEPDLATGLNRLRDRLNSAWERAEHLLRELRRDERDLAQADTRIQLTWLAFVNRVSFISRGLEAGLPALSWPNRVGDLSSDLAVDGVLSLIPGAGVFKLRQRLEASFASAKAGS
jgi:hypothetical protein